MTEKERLIHLLTGRRVDRAPVLCPGGMMTMASRDVMLKTGCVWPDVHRDAERMATLSKAMHDEAGLENIGIPFCMTVEAEALGGEVEDGDGVTEPSIVSYPLQSVGQWRELRRLDPLADGRLPTVIRSTRTLSRRFPDIPVIGNLVGPISLATSLMDATILYRSLRKDPDDVRDLFDFLTANIMEYGEALIQSGADLIVIADPSATGEILGPRMFREFALPYLNRIIKQMHQLGRPVIVHICGDISPIYDPLNELGFDCLSVDSAVSIREARRYLEGRRLMGNVSTLLLQNGPVERIQAASLKLLRDGIDILAPACGLSARTPVGHIRAMTEAARMFQDA